MTSNIITLERPPLIYAEEADYLSVNLHVFEVRFRKGTTGYDEIWKDGRQVVANVRWLLKDSADKQVSIPQSIEWEVIDAYTLRVKRFYTDYLGTDFTVVYDCRSGAVPISQHIERRKMVTEIAVIKKQNQGLLTEAETLVVRAEAIEISDDEDMEIGVNLLG
ncbi:unnamed protein product, partial [marine sediment metagenome]